MWPLFHVLTMLSVSVFFFVVEDATLINLVFTSKRISGMPLNIVPLKTGRNGMIPKLWKLIVYLLDVMCLTKFSTVLIISWLTFQINKMSINIMDQCDALYTVWYPICTDFSRLYNHRIQNRQHNPQAKQYMTIIFYSTWMKSVFDSLL